MPASQDNSAPPVARYAPPAARLKQLRRIVRATQQSWVVRFLKQADREFGAHVADLTRPQARAAWLLRYRQLFRRMELAPPASALRLYLCDCPEYMLPLAIWLLGRCTTRFKHYELFEYARCAPMAARRHAARALRRIEAWPELRQLADLTPEDRKIAWYATAPNVAHRSFNERLNNFAEHIDHSHAADALGPSRMALWFADLDWIRQPPKPLEYIREILQRIHRWVHGAD